MGGFVLGAIVGVLVTAAFAFVLKRSMANSVDRCQSENERLKSMVTNSEMEHNHLTSEIRKLKGELRVEKDNYDFLKREYEKVIDENLRLKKTINNLQAK